MFHVVADIEVGTPSQWFSIILSLKQSDLYLLSTACKDPPSWYMHRYDSTKSSTYIANGTAVNVSFWSATVEGYTSQDTFHIGNFSVSDQNFAEATVIDTAVREKFEGILGLGSKFGNSSTGSGNLATSMYSQGLIRKNVFSMTFPSTEHRLGELAFGGTNGDVDLDDVVMIPVTNVTGNNWEPEVLRNTWQVSAGYVKLGHGTVINKPLDAIRPGFRRSSRLLDSRRM
jgi:hypothetical protein